MNFEEIQKLKEIKEIENVEKVDKEKLKKLKNTAKILEDRKVKKRSTYKLWNIAVVVILAVLSNRFLLL